MRTVIFQEGQVREDGMNSGEAHQLELERQEMALDALMRCRQAGADDDALDVLASEIGIREQWRKYEPKQSN